MIINKIGIKNDANDPSIIASPKSIRLIPKYIGCLLNEKGPVMINVEGIPSGLTVVLFCLNSISVHILIIIPNVTAIKPTKLMGK